MYMYVTYVYMRTSLASDIPYYIHVCVLYTCTCMCVLQVLVDGAGTSGPDTITIEANSITTYPLTFAPTLNEETIGQLVYSVYVYLVRASAHIHACTCMKVDIDVHVRRYTCIYTYV